MKPTNVVIQISLVIAALLSGCSPSKDASEPLSGVLPRFELLPIGADFPIGEGRAERGYLIVAADRAAPSAGTYRLPVAILRADEGSIALPPVIMLSGGPGSGSLSAAAYPGAYPWVGKRDFIVFGPRGTQHAVPALTCPDYNTAESADDASARRDAATDCRARFTAAGIDLSTFHTKALAQDVDDLRQALGYETVALYGLSYGSRVGLTVARDFPDTVDRMVLDSPLPHTVRYDAEIAENIRRVLNRIIAQCAADTGCNAAYPDLSARVFERLERAKTDPVQIRDANGQRKALSAADLVSLLPIGSSRGTVQIPRTLDAIARDDADFLAELWSSESGASRFDWGKRLSVWCSEAWPHSDKPTHAFADLNLAVVPDEVCEIWNVPRRPVSERRGTVSNIPTLVIAGAFDPLTPPEWAAQTVETLTRGKVVIFPFGHHTETTHWGGDGCAMSIAAAFMDAPEPDPRTLDLTCIDRSAAPTFALRP